MPATATPADLADLIHELPGYSSILPETLVVDGRPAVRVDFRYVGPPDCDIGATTRVAMVGRDHYDDQCTCGAQQRWLIFDVHGTRVVVEEYSLGVNLVYRLPELDRIVQSLHFD